MIYRALVMQEAFMIPSWISDSFHSSGGWMWRQNHMDSTSAVNGGFFCFFWGGGGGISMSASPINILLKPLEEAVKCFFWEQCVTICQSRKDMSGNFLLLWVAVCAKYKILLTRYFPSGACWNRSWFAVRGCPRDDVDRCVPWRITRYEAVRKKNCWRCDITRTPLWCDLLNGGIPE